MFRQLARNSSRFTSKRLTSPRFYSSVPPNQGSTPSVPAMLAVASMGFAAYYTLVQSREGKSKNINSQLIQC